MKIHDTAMNERVKLVCFDVVSLFMRVPVAEAIEVISTVCWKMKHWTRE